MTISAILIGTLAFYFLYNMSARADKRMDALSVWLRKQGNVTKYIGIAALVLSFILLVISEGFGTGLLFGFIVLMTAGSLIVLLSPLFNRR